MINLIVLLGVSIFVVPRSPARHGSYQLTPHGICFHYPLPVAATKGVVVVVVVVGRLLGQCLGVCSSYTTSPSPSPSLASMSTSARRRLLRDFRRYVDDNIVRQSWIFDYGLVAAVEMLKVLDEKPNKYRLESCDIYQLLLHKLFATYIVLLLLSCFRFSLSL